MGLYTKFGTGLASCQICQKKIQKKEIDVCFTGYQMEKHFHSNCIEERVKITRKEKKKNVNN